MVRDERRNLRHFAGGREASRSRRTQAIERSEEPGTDVQLSSDCLTFDRGSRVAGAGVHLSRERLRGEAFRQAHNSGSRTRFDGDSPPVAGRKVEGESPLVCKLDERSPL
jgi:hypothetical protein